MTVPSRSRFNHRTVAAVLAISFWFGVTVNVSVHQSSSVDLASNSGNHPSTLATTTTNSGDSTHLSKSNVVVSNTNSTSCHDKEPLLRILQDAGIPNASDHCADLPTWKQVVDFYGPEPVVDGLETSCDAYRTMIVTANNNKNKNNNSTTVVVPPLPRVAGLFNTGTNALAKLLQRNLLKVEELHYFYYDVPWGKHVPYHKRWNVTLPKHNPTPKSLVLPVVLIRDPYWWMQSMCKTAYGVKWKHSEKHCPNLTPDKDTDNNNNNSVPVVTKYSFGRKDPVRFQWHHDSLVHLWNDYYEEYYFAIQQQQQPRLMVRFEDMLFHGPRLLETLAACLQLPPPSQTFEYVAETSKQHGSGTNLLAAMARYGSSSAAGRTRGMNRRDLDYARQHLSGVLLQRFRYPIA